MDPSPAEQAAHLTAAAADLADAVPARPPDAKVTTQWTAREVIAHLIGWNRLYVGGCQAILAGRVPAYYADPGPNFGKINAILVARHGRGDMDGLLADLRASAADLAAYIGQLPQAPWAADRGVRQGGRVLTVQRAVDALIEDYGHHRVQMAGHRRARAAVAHEIPARAALRLEIGEVVDLGERDKEWPEFVFVTTTHGAGWVPARHLRLSGPGAVVEVPYDTTELATRAGEVLDILAEDRQSGWLWCRAADGREGWVPVRTLDER